GTTAPMNAPDISTAQTAPAGQMGAAIAAAHSALAAQQASPLAMTGPAPNVEPRQQEKTVLGDVGPMDFGGASAQPQPQPQAQAVSPYASSSPSPYAAPVAPMTPAAFAPSPV